MTNTIHIEMVPISALKAAAYNPRRDLTTTEERQLAKSLETFGAVDPAVINEDGTIIGGHQRVKVAASVLGWKTFPCIRLALDKTKERQLNLALNKIQGGFDEQMLAQLLTELKDETQADLDASGFDEAELDLLIAKSLARSGLVLPDEVPELPTEPKTLPGDLWVLGRHRLACGDATDASDVKRLLGANRPRLMITDPPYGCDYEPAWRAREAAKGNLSYAARRTGKVPNDDRADWREAWALSPAEVAYVWHGGLHARVALESLEACGFVLRAQIIWGKSHLPISRGHYHWRTEPCYYAVRKGAKAHWIGDRRQTTLWDDIALDENVQGGHGTQKPVEAMARALRNHAGEVYDPFVGTGTTIIAAEMEGRCCFAMDISPAYVDVARIRWERFSGEEAVLENRGSA